ncbi:DNA primase/helicase [Bacillus phage phi18]|nr:ATP-dependent DNA helicase [Bacillus phage vB_BsuM-Goe9]UAV84377.1 DNA primase/helicase [Bacillus phage phi18]WIT26240.1 hypothetical protein [Bacillus phage SPO1L3]WIT26638.1 hypothetical protein [Bacillus phage SPO1L5]
MSDTYEFSESFQRKILSVMARDRLAYTSFQELLKPSYFKSEIHIDLARIIHEHYDRESSRAKAKGTDVNPPSIHVLFEEVRRLTKSNKKKAQIKEQYEEEIIDLMEEDLTDAEYVKDSIVRFAKDAAIKEAILESVVDIEKGANSRDVDYSVIEERIKEAVQVGEVMEDLGVSYFDRAKERMDEYAQGTDGVRRVPTGMEGVDKTLGGGLGGGELGIVIAPPGRGKSIALTNIGAGAVLEGYSVAHYTMEMPERQVEKRYDNRLLQKDTQYLLDPENASRSFKALQMLQKTAGSNRGKNGDLIIKKFPVNGCTINTIRSHLTKLRMERNFVPDVIIIDYGDLISPRRTYSDKRFELESVYLDMRDLASEYDCPVWSASQATRGALDKKVITIGDLAEAFNKANIADFMMALCQTEEEKEDGEMRLHVAKHRSGTSSITISGDIEYSTMTLTAYSED